MKIGTLTLAILASLSVAPQIQAGEFNGFFIGGKIGNNSSDISGGALATGFKNTTTWGIDEGYNWDTGNYLLGADIFVNDNHKADHTSPSESYSSSAYGLGLKLGISMDNWLPYVHLGFANTKAGYDASAINSFGLLGGVGVEYKFAPNWSINTEWSTSSATNNGSQLSNNNITLGIRYYLGAPAAPAPVVAKIAEPIVAKNVEPVVAPTITQPPVVIPAPAPVLVTEVKSAPQFKESWKTILTENPVLLKGANFATNSAKLLKGADAKLNEVLKAVKQHPEVKLEVNGYTDNRGKKASNQKLSEKRAVAVKAWLVKQKIAANRISTNGYADRQPIADNTTKEGRAANRRVEVHYVIKEETKVRVTR